MKIYFKKYKYTHQIFYSSASGASVDITNDGIIFDLPMHPQLSGTYFTFGEVRRTNSKITYEARKMGHNAVFYIDEEINSSKYSIYLENLEGIILKA
ncbi:hypothetical protein [Flavobacterium sp. TSSA_36]|uniref:hypothetical protein n=1 Tax=Flavobacterium sp. TSSA_36 TaxID=3447669 RepID=UPI003F396D9F